MRQALVLSLFAATASGQTLKFATLAPQGSAWKNIFEEAARDLNQKTQGRVKIKYFAGGIAGDERDAIRKVKAGQLHGAAVTSIGLMQIVKDVRVLELPGMFRTDAELDYVREKVAPMFEKKFEEAGWVLLGWGDVGWIHNFSSIKLQSQQDLAKIKMWVWTDDPVARKMFERLGVNGVPLGVPEVLPALQTGMINAAYGSALSTLALQWYTKVKYMSEGASSYGIGAALVSKKAFDSLQPADRELMLSEGRKLQARLIAQIRKDNAAAMEVLKKQGIQVVPAQHQYDALLQSFAEQVWGDMTGMLYSKELLDQVKKLVADYRAGKR